MDSITSGEVKFCGKNIANMGEKELADLRLDEMGFIFQQMYMLKNLTVLDNIILPAVQSNKNTETRKETALRGQELMRKLGIIFRPFSSMYQASFIAYNRSIRSPSRIGARRSGSDARKVVAAWRVELRGAHTPAPPAGLASSVTAPADPLPYFVILSEAAGRVEGSPGRQLLIPAAPSAWPARS